MNVLKIFIYLNIVSQKMVCVVKNYMDSNKQIKIFPERIRGAPSFFVTDSEGIQRDDRNHLHSMKRTKNSPYTMPNYKSK